MLTWQTSFNTCHSTRACIIRTRVCVCAYRAHGSVHSWRRNFLKRARSSHLVVVTTSIFIHNEIEMSHLRATTAFRQREDYLMPGAQMQKYLVLLRAESRSSWNTRRLERMANEGMLCFRRFACLRCIIRNWIRFQWLKSGYAMNTSRKNEKSVNYSRCYEKNVKNCKGSIPLWEE